MNNSFTYLTQELARCHNNWLDWYEMQLKADSPEAVAMCALRAEEFKNRESHYRALLVQKVMERAGYELDAFAKYREV